MVFEFGRVRADGLDLPHLLGPEGAQRLGLGLGLGGRLLGVAAALREGTREEGGFFFFSG